LTADETGPNVQLCKRLADISGFDVDEAVRRMAGNTEIYLHSLRVYLSGLPGQLETIRKDGETEDWKNFTIRVHGLKSSLYQIGAKALGDKAFEMEKRSRAGDTAFCRTEYTRLLDSGRKLCDNLAAIVGTSDEEI
jgi:HPt (histidine-containing phosphotransfer) domain-containing protein